MHDDDSGTATTTRNATSASTQRERPPRRKTESDNTDAESKHKCVQAPGLGDSGRTLQPASPLAASKMTTHLQIAAVGLAVVVAVEDIS